MILEISFVLFKHQASLLYMSWNSRCTLPDEGGSFSIIWPKCGFLIRNLYYPKNWKGQFSILQFVLTSTCGLSKD